MSEKIYNDQNKQNATTYTDSEVDNFPELDIAFSKLKELQHEHISMRIANAEKALEKIDKELKEFLQL
ncbi:MAG: hypothetical protein IJU92_06585 [Spirochaetaceae bacterium]|nr:hypothetical protein [Spirochaetaceae bacterium]